jgi:flagellar biosynthesis GTPase FlhF
MMHRRRHAKYPSTSAAAGSDTDALQTDVMRFMSIIGLCLMAVFALVQGIPLQEPGKPAQPSQPARLREEISLQQQQLRELQAELQILKSSMARTRQHLTSAKEQLQQANGQAQQAREERDQLESRLENLGRQLEQQRQALADIEQDARQKEQNLDKLRQRLLNTQRQLDHSRTEIEALQRQSQQPAVTPVIKRQAPPVPVPEAVPTPVPKPATARQGFTLRFESDAALDRLVAAGSVSLYAMAGQQAWRLSMTTGRPAAAQVSFPRWFHEMSVATVPAHYSRSLEDAAPGQSSVVWGVQLPAAAKQAIASLTRQRQGGALLIRGDGQVVLED